MANLYRIGCAVLVWVVLVLLSLNVQASVMKSSQSVNQYSVAGAPRGSTPAGACSNALQAYKNGVTVTTENTWATSFIDTGVCGSPGACRFTNGNNVSGACQQVAIFTITATACPANSMEYLGACWCDSGFKDSANRLSCEADSDTAKCAALSGSADNSYTRTFASSSSSAVCPAVGGGSNCTVDIKWDMTYSVNGVKYQSGIGKYTGKTCTATASENAKTAAPAPAPPPTPPPEPGTPGAPAKNTCPTGQYPGTINGVFTCVPPSSTAPVTTTNTTTTTTPAPPDSPSSAPVTSSTTKETTCTGNTCTTTTTTSSSSSGGSGGAGTPTTTTTEQSKDDFCTLNPKSPQCIVGSFGGSCGAGFACEGDAVQCAIAKETYTRNCQLIDATSAESQLYDQSKTQTGSVTGDLPGSESVTIGATSFDQTAHFAAVGLSDLNLTVAGNDVTIKLSELNTWLQLLGNLGVAVTLLVAIRISLGGAV